jgi:hypothetical protein
MFKESKPQITRISLNVKKKTNASNFLFVYWIIQIIYIQEDVMEAFIQRHQDAIKHVLSGFDRVLFRGTLRSISYLKGMEVFLYANHILLKDFGAFVSQRSDQIKEQAEQFARQHQRPFQYLSSPSVSKEEIAREIMKRDNITAGLICVFSCVEPCMSYAIRKDRATQKLKLIPAERKCLHFYFYSLDREFGFMHVRLQSWFPCPIQVCINGREWLAQQMNKAGIRYQRRDNCFVDIADPQKAQTMADAQMNRNWTKLLDKFGPRFNPLIRINSGLNLRGYYWTIRQSEYATDVVFKDSSSLAAIYPGLTRHAIENFSSEDVMRFMGRNHNVLFSGEVVSDLKKRPEGVRIKHRVEDNSIKMYDKQGQVLRIETTINNPRRFKTYRQTIRKGKCTKEWIPMRKSVADIYRRVEISRAANSRYLEALAIIGDKEPSHRLFDSVSRPVFHNGCRYRSLRPITPEETKLFQAVLNGKFLIHGFRNADLRQMLFSKTNCEDEKCRAMGRMTRLISLLRVHGLIRKVSKTRIYRVTEKGHRVMSTSLIFREANIALLAIAS